MLREFLCLKGLQPAVSLGRTVECLRVYLWRESWAVLLSAARAIWWHHLPGYTNSLGCGQWFLLRTHVKNCLLRHGRGCSWYRVLLGRLVSVWHLCTPGLSALLSLSLGFCSDSEVEKGDRRGLHWIWPQSCHCILFQLWLSFFILKADRVYLLDLCEMEAKECWHFFYAGLILPCP